MVVDVLKHAFEERKPIVKADLQKVLKIRNNNTLNQMISHLVSFGVIRRYENGIYYIPVSSKKFAHLKPSLGDVINKKYLDGHCGIKTGAQLLYKYKLTSQVSSYYEILTNNVSPSTRSKRLYDGKVIVSHPPFMIHKNNLYALEFLELIRNLHFSDYGFERSIMRLRDIFKDLDLKREEIIDFSSYYSGKRYAGFRNLVKEILPDEVA